MDKYNEFKSMFDNKTLEDIRKTLKISSSECICYFNKYMNEFLKIPLKEKSPFI